MPPGETPEAAPCEGTGQLITLGEALVCIAPTGPVAFEGARDYRAHPGGAELNTCLAMRKLGLPSVLFTRLGDDGPGRLLARAMRASGIAVSAETDPDRPTGLYLREWLPDGVRRLAYYRRDSAASALGATPLPLPRMTTADLALVTGITIALGPGPRRACAQVVEAAHEAGARVCFDPNYRPRLWDSESAARTVLIECMRSVDVLLLSEDDAALLFGSTDPDVVLDASLSEGPRVVVFKQGERGVSVATEDGTRFDQPAADITEELDPVGAGDGFNGGFLAGLLSGLDLPHSTRLGAYVGARAVEAVGDNAGYPDVAELPDEFRTLLAHAASPAVRTATIEEPQLHSEIPSNTDDLIARFAALYSAVVADVLDELGHRRTTMVPGLARVSGQGTLAGRAATMRVIAVDAVPSQPYRIQFEAVDELRPGEVMVVAAPDVASAFWGELISTRAAVKGCLGAVVDGYCRDVTAIQRRGFPVFARGAHPADSAGRLDAVEFGTTIECGGVTVHHGDIIVADADGITVVPQSLAAEVLALAEQKSNTEDEVREVLRGGATIGDTYDRFGVM